MEAAEEVTTAAQAAAETVEAAQETAAAAAESMADYAAELEASLKQGPPTDDPVWARFEELLNSKETISVTIDSAVKGGVIAYVDEVRAFIPASKLANGYVENLEEYKGKTVDAVVITAEKAGKKLVLSVREALKRKQAAEREARMAECVEGAVLEGTVDSVMDYGAFIKLDNGASGLLHVSQISWKRVATPADVLTKGDRITVKIIAVKDGKISLSKKALEEAPAREPRGERPERGERRERPRRDGEERPERGERGERRERRERRDREEVFNYKETGKASTNLGDLLAGIKLDQ
ncbi:MAG: S1 RNA-binding domain-containing protein [Lachnospiraceae bacterium]|nr:S1 RNA-binding domain-containing protein [Lachnospiraceae bacterium]